MHTEKVTCDGCGADLTTRTNSVDYRLVLTSQSKPGHGAGFYTDVMIYPPTERAHHFCGLSCLDHWRDREKHYLKLMQERWDQWKAEHGTKNAGGTFTYSYPVPPKETTNEWQAVCRSAADAAFPLG